MQIQFGAPEGYSPDEAVLARAAAIGAVTGADVRIHHDPIKAVAGADVVVTDTWVSMGKEDEAAARQAIFSPYSVTTELLDHAEPDAIVMHCLPAYRGKEIAAEVLDGPRSVVWDEAENRRHAQKAVLMWLYERFHADPVDNDNEVRRG
jgi:ornithine carbamoyltransferase